MNGSWRNGQGNVPPKRVIKITISRVDSVHNRLILEYKRPGILKSSNANRANQEAIKQVKDYILDVAQREKREAHRLAGVATDGHFFIFVRRVGGFRAFASLRHSPCIPPQPRPSHLGRGSPPRFWHCARRDGRASVPQVWGTPPPPKK